MAKTKASLTNEADKAESMTPANEDQQHILTLLHAWGLLWLCMICGQRLIFSGPRALPSSMPHSLS